MKNDKWQFVSGLLTSICHLSLVICHLASFPCRNTQFADGRHSCGVKLFLMQQRVKTILGDQFFMTPLFDD